MLKKLEKVLMPLAEAIGRNKYLMSIRDGFLVSTPLLIAGSVFLIIANFPIQAWMDWLAATVINQETGETLATFLSKPSDATFTIMAVFAVMGIAYSFAKQMGTNPLFGAAVALMSWFLVMPYTVAGSVDVNGAAVAVSLSGISLGWLGAKGIFVGIICAFVSVHIYTWVEQEGLGHQDARGRAADGGEILRSSDSCSICNDRILPDQHDLWCIWNQRI